MASRLFRHTLRRAGALGLALVALTLAACGAAPAQTPDTAQASAGAPVIFRGDTLFRLTGTLGPFTPEERAEALARRIERLANDPLAKAADVAVRDTSGVTDVQVGDVVVLSVTERDAAEAGMSRAALAALWAGRIQQVIQSTEGAASLRSILVGFFFALLATGALAAVFVLMGRAFPAAYGRLRSWKGTRLPAIRFQRMELLSAEQVVEGTVWIARAVRVILVILLIYFYLPLVFSFFPWTQGVATTLFSYVLDPLTRAGRGFVEYLPSLFAVAVIVVVVRYLLGFIHLFFLGLERGTVGFPGFYRDWSDPTYKIVRFVVLVFAAIMIYPYLPGSGTTAFQGISVFVGVLVSFGSGSAIANIVSGVVMTYMRPFQIGDRVKIADTVGDVVMKTLLVTRVRTIKNVDVTIPNAMVLASHIVNYNSSAKDRGLILHSAVTIGYDAPWRKVHELLIAAARATQGLLETPEPFVMQTALDDFYVRYEINAYTEKPNAMARIYSDLHQNIQDQFNQAGVEIMSPHYGALRDGNRKAIPDDHLPPTYQAPAFRIFPQGPVPESSQ